MVTDKLIFGILLTYGFIGIWILFPCCFLGSWVYYKGRGKIKVRGRILWVLGACFIWMTTQVLAGKYFSHQSHESPTNEVTIALLISLVPSLIYMFVLDHGLQRAKGNNKAPNPIEYVAQTKNHGYRIVILLAIGIFLFILYWILKFLTAIVGS